MVTRSENLSDSIFAAEHQTPSQTPVTLFDPLPGDPRGDLCAANLTRRRLENQCIPRAFEEAFLRCPDVIRK